MADDVGHLGRADRHQPDLPQYGGTPPVQLSVATAELARADGKAALSTLSSLG